MLDFKGGSISKDDWEGIKRVLKPSYRVLEFGTGISTKLFHDFGCEIISVETDPRWVERAKPECPRATFMLWDNKTLPEGLAEEHFDLVFVDGVTPRDLQLQIAIKVADKILIHDGARQHEQEIISKYLREWKEVPVLGRCRYFVKPVASFAALTSCTPNYIHYLKALLNSFDSLGMELDFHVLALEFGADKLTADYSFNLIVHEREYDDYRKYFPQQPDGNVAKKSRYMFLEELSDYKVVLLLDADLMLVRDIIKFFHLVNGTDVILGCNERFKWPLNRFFLDGEQLPQIHMDWMVCNVPLFFCPSKHECFIREAKRCAIQLQDHEGRYPSDIYTMNVALYTAGATNKVIPLPAYAWTGVHTSYINPWTRIYKRNGKWESFCGEPVYMLHGRWDSEGSKMWYLNELEKRFNELNIPSERKASLRNQALNTIKQIEEEFNFMRNLK